jgi:hypothetical protein
MLIVYRTRENKIDINKKINHTWSEAPLRSEVHGESGIIPSTRLPHQARGSRRTKYLLEMIVGAVRMSKSNIVLSTLAVFL